MKYGNDVTNVVLALSGRINNIFFCIESIIFNYSKRHYRTLEIYTPTRFPFKKNTSEFQKNIR